MIDSIECLAGTIPQAEPQLFGALMHGCTAHCIFTHERSWFFVLQPMPSAWAVQSSQNVPYCGVWLWDVGCGLADRHRVGRPNQERAVILLTCVKVGSKEMPATAYDTVLNVVLNVNSQNVRFVKRITIHTHTIRMAVDATSSED